MITFDYLKDRIKSEDGIELWKWKTDWLVLAREDKRYGKFYPMREYSLEQVIDIDPLIRCRWHGVFIK